MIERTTSLDQVIAGVMWAAVILTFAASALLLLHGAGFAGILVAEIACAASAYAAVRSIKCYAVRICHKVDTAALEQDVQRVVGLPPQRVR